MQTPKFCHLAIGIHIRTASVDRQGRAKASLASMHYLAKAVECRGHNRGVMGSHSHQSAFRTLFFLLNQLPFLLNGAFFCAYSSEVCATRFVTQPALKADLQNISPPGQKVLLATLPISPSPTAIMTAGNFFCCCI